MTLSKMADSTARRDISQVVHHPSRRRSQTASRVREWCIRSFLVLCAAFSILITFTIILVLFREASRFFAMDGVTTVEFFSSTKWSPLFSHDIGVWPLVSGTLLVTAVAMAKRFEDAGADTLTFHPRVAPDRRSRPPKWEYIALVKQAVSIPVFGNGNVFDPIDCLRMIETTGCDGVAVGRMAIARPWLFAEWSDGLQFDSDVYLRSALRLAGLLEKHFDPSKALRRFKKFGFYFAANFKFGHTLYKWIQNAENMEAAKAFLYQFFKASPETVSRPNLNFFN